MSTENNYETIATLVDQTAVERNQLLVTFKCPESGGSIEAKGSIPSDRGIKGKVAADSKNALVRTISRTLRSWLGSGAVGRIAGNAATEVVKQKTNGVISASQREQATVAAFQSVASQWESTESGGLRLSSKDGATHPEPAPSSATG